MFNTVVSASLGSCIEVIHSIFTDEVCCVSHHTRLHAIAVRHSILAVFTLGTRLWPPRAHERSASAQDEPRALGYYVRSMVWSRHTVCEKDEVLHQYFSFLSAKTLERMAADIHVLRLLLLLKKKEKKFIVDQILCCPLTAWWLSLGCAEICILLFWLLLSFAVS